MRLMKLVVLSAALCAFGSWGQEQKAPSEKPLTPQQQRMQQCNADAKAQTFKDNAARQAFMSKCLKGEKAMTQQEKMTACNKETTGKNLKGDARKAFMSECLKG